MSAVTGIFNGIQQASAVHNGANMAVDALGRSIDTVNNATNAANPLIQNSANTAISGVQGATDTAIGGVNNAVNLGQMGVNGATGQANQYLNPYIQQGQQSLSTLNNILEDPNSQIQTDPGFQFRLAQGQQALERSAAARGASQGGGAMKSLAQYSQGLASQEYANAFGRYQSRVGALGSLAGMGLQAGNNAGQNLTNAAQYNSGIGLQGANITGNLGVGASQYAGQTGINSTLNQVGNSLNAAQFAAQTQQNQGQVRLNEQLGAAKAWGGALNSVGSFADSAISGGFSGGKGFKFGDMIKGF